MILPLKTTHLLQPLAAVFYSLYRSWRVILHKWKNEVHTEGSFDKNYFPSLPKRFVNTQKTKYEKNVHSGFRVCGVCPLDRNEPLSKLPILDSFISENNSLLNETLKVNPHGKNAKSTGSIVLNYAWTACHARLSWSKEKKRQRTMSSLITPRMKVIRWCVEM